MRFHENYYTYNGSVVFFLGLINFLYYTCMLFRRVNFCYNSVYLIKFRLSIIKYELKLLNVKLLTY
jgi:hypothetical protein